MKKTAFKIATTLFTAIALTSCTDKNKSQKPITLVMAEVNPPDTISGSMDNAFKEKVEELSGGKIKIELQCSAILGDEESITTLMTSPNSTIHLARISAFTLTSYGCETSSLLTIPFTFKNKEHFWKFAGSAAASAILNEPYAKKVGVKGLFFGEEGFRHFFATSKLTNPQSFNGLNLRVTNDSIMRGVAFALKANAISVGFADLYSALSTGIAEAAEQPLANYLANHFHKVAPYMILDGHTLGVTEVIITSEVWDSLSNENKKILEKASRYAGEYCRKVSQEAEDKAVAQLLEEGAVFTEVNDISEWQKTCSKVIEEASKVNPELYGDILKLAK